MSERPVRVSLGSPVKACVDIEIEATGAITAVRRGRGLQALHGETLLGDDGRWSIVRFVSRPVVVEAVAIIVVVVVVVVVVVLVVPCILLCDIPVAGTSVCTCVYLKITRARRLWLQFLFCSSRGSHRCWIITNKFTMING